jgi:hypothetical protein
MAPTIVESQHGGAAHLLAGHRTRFGLMLFHLNTSLCSLQAAIIDNSDIPKNWEFIVPGMWLSGHRFNHMAYSSDWWMLQCS